MTRSIALLLALAALGSLAGCHGGGIGSGLAGAVLAAAQRCALSIAIDNTPDDGADVPSRPAALAVQEPALAPSSGGAPGTAVAVPASHAATDAPGDPEPVEIASLPISRDLGSILTPCAPGRDTRFRVAALVQIRASMTPVGAADPLRETVVAASCQTTSRRS